MPHPSANKFDYNIEWDILHLSDEFPVSPYPICINVDHTRAMKLHMQLDMNRSNTGNYTFTEPRSQRVQIQGRSAAPTPCRCCCPQTSSIQNLGVPLISGMQPVIVPYKNV